MYKAIISDLDGTLLNSDHQISQRTCETVRALVARGIPFILATGRHFLDVRTFRDALGVPCDLITANGALVSNPDDQLVFQDCLPHDIAAELVRGLPAHVPDVNINVFDPHGWHVRAEIPEALKFHRESGFFYRISDLVELAGQGINKVFYTGDPEALLVLEEHLVAQYGGQVGIAFSSEDCLEVMARHVNKGNAVQRALAAHGVELHEAIAFGDGMNDLEMLSMVGHGVVMANATERLQRELPTLPRAKTCDEDGVAQYLSRVFF